MRWRQSLLQMFPPRSSEDVMQNCMRTAVSNQVHIYVGPQYNTFEPQGSLIYILVHSACLMITLEPRARRPCNPLLLVVGFGTWAIRWCGMHTVNLGLLPLFSGSCVAILLELCSLPSSISLRNLHFSKFKSGVKTAS